MSNINGTTHRLAETVSVNLKTPSSQQEISAKVTGHLTKIEEELLTLYSQGSKDGKYDEIAIDGKQFEYKRAIRIHEGFQTLMKNAHEILMRGIQNLKIS